MSLTPGLPQHFEKDRLAFPGMQPEETLVWRAWLALFEGQYDAFDYNTRIGAGDIPPNVTNEATVRDAILNSQLRMDAIGWHGIAGLSFPDARFTPRQVYGAIPNAQATIIEVKRRAATAAGTEIQSYGHLWAEEFGAYPAAKLLVVAASYSQTIKPVLDRAGVQLQIVTVDFTSLAKRSYRKQGA
jgi:hypothetical protein